MTQTPPFQPTFLPVTLSELGIITLHSFQEHEAAMAQQRDGMDISQAPSDCLLTLAAEEHSHDT